MRFVIALPYAWLVVFFLLPFALVLGIALGTNAPDSAPPVELGLSLKNFTLLFTDDLYVAAWLSSLRIAATSTLVIACCWAIPWPTPSRGRTRDGGRCC